MSYKEIVTKAIIAKGKKTYKNDYIIELSEIPSTVLGCWIINHHFEGKENNNKILINGSFDVNVWYAYENDTKTAVVTKKITYKEEETMNNINTDNDKDKDIIIRSLKQPTCISATSNENTIKLEVEKELGIEVVGDTKVKVSSVDEEDDWDNLNEINTEEINQNYIDKEIIK